MIKSIQNLKFLMLSDLLLESREYLGAELKCVK
jgi:hypothetical protein